MKLQLNVFASRCSNLHRTDGSWMQLVFDYEMVDIELLASPPKLTIP